MDFIHVTVAAIIRRKDKFLLVKEKSSSGQIVYNQPAGHVELNESLTEAVIREVKEETGLTFNPTDMVGTYLLSPAANGKTYLRFCFVGDTIESESVKPEDPDILDALWFSGEEIAGLPKESLRSALVLNCLSDYLQGKRIPLESLVFSDNEHQLGDECLKRLIKKS